MSSVVSMKAVQESIHAKEVEDILTYLEGVKNRVENGETLAVFLGEVPAEIDNISMALLGVEDQDVFEFIGTLEFYKKAVLELF